MKLRPRLVPVLLVLLLAAVLALAVWLYELRSTRSAAPPAPSVALQPVVSVPRPVTSASGPAPAAVAPVYEEPAPASAMSAADIVPALVDLLGRKAVESLLQTDDFAHRVVASVDNLGRAHATSRLWPVNRTSGRFTVQDVAGSTVIGADNGSRYTPLVLLLESVDAGRAAALYARLRPLLQQAYRDLGYATQSFDSRLLEVIDIMLAAPQLQYPVKLTLTQAQGPQGPIVSEQPWVRYEYADPTLEARPAGQKIMMRVGAVNERRLKTRLREFRQQLLRQMPAR